MAVLKVVDLSLGLEFIAFNMWPKWGYTAVIAWGSRGEGVGDRRTEVHTGKEVQGVLWGGGVGG